jgi:hypothetical protein
MTCAPATGGVFVRADDARHAAQRRRFRPLATHGWRRERVRIADARGHGLEVAARRLEHEALHGGERGGV